MDNDWQADYVSLTKGVCLNLVVYGCQMVHQWAKKMLCYDIVTILEYIL